MHEVERWGMYEIVLKGTGEGNPCTDVALEVTFTHGNECIRVDGFYDGNIDENGVNVATYKVRFMPMISGKWNYSVSSGAPVLHGTEGELLCTDPSASNHGPVRVKDTYQFAYEDGTRHISVGTTCYALLYQDGARIEKTFSELEKYGFNKIRICIFPKHYDYNLKEPEFFPFVKKEDGMFDYTQFDPAFFRHLDAVIARLSDMDIQADLILFHPYDRWGFKSMPKEVDDRYLKYMAARYSAYRNVWWSLANEFDIITNFPDSTETSWHSYKPENKELEDWERFAQILLSHDPYGHLRSIHNCMRFYDHTKPWVTHMSAQRTDLIRTVEYVREWREKYKKPIVYDECAYEGNIQFYWGNISGQEMTRRFWMGYMMGGYMGHGETYVGYDDILWWSHGGELHGESPSRIRFLKDILDEIPDNLQIVPVNGDYCDTCAIAGEGYRIYYYNMFRPSSWTFYKLEKGEYSVEIIDTWNMTVEKLPGTFSGEFTIDLPGREYMAARLIRMK